MKKTNTPSVIEAKADFPFSPQPPSKTSARSKRRNGAAHKGEPASRASVAEHSNGDFESELSAEAILAALVAFKKGDFSVRLPLTWTGVSGKVADTFNEVAELMAHQTEDLSRISRVVGKEGRIQERLSTGHFTGAWSERVDSVNNLIDCLAHPISETARVIGAVAKGDLSQSMAMEIEGRKLEGDFLRTAKTVNTMVNQLGAFASEVNRVAREVGT